MESNNARVLKQLQSFVATIRRFASPGSNDLFKAGLEWAVRVYLPLIPLTDGGKARGRMVGLMQQYGVTLEPTLINDRSHVKGEIDQAAYTQGVKEGRSLSPQKTRAILRVLRVAKEGVKRERLKDKRPIVARIRDTLVKALNRG